ncbi:4Fe-4S dicluster domain-containing protein [uncultured Dubosiella sp.]|uniref:4Fe-4S dicluster domain-containing protein n=1 Tax=uncultured Dubosiella sp. TaxID=1937011 RepID=UPI0025910E17|nr:4Fe-4S dicluster domain-containing protein [uncultured Dubosiella sp.]
MKKIPVLYEKKEECCGCTACCAICPKEAISMTEDEEGFEYPHIDESMCIRCYQCLMVCPFKE